MTGERSSGGSGGTRRGGRGRRTPAADQASAATPVDALVSEPRVVRRRPAGARGPADAGAVAAAETEQPKGRGRRRAAAKPEEKKPEEKPAEPEQPKRRQRGRAPAEQARQEAAEPKAKEEKEAKPATPRRRSRAATATEDGSVEARIAALGDAMAEVRRAVDDLGARVERATRHARLGVFVDVPNLLYGAERVDLTVDVGKLLDMLSEGRELVRATAYSPVSDDPSDPVEQQRFVAPFVPYEYRIVTKPLKRFADGSIKGNFDVEMAIDMVTMAERLDVIAVVSGDADFARAVEVVQGRGVRVEVVAYASSTSAEMRALADSFLELGEVADKLRP